MLRQFITGGVVRALLIAAMLAGVTACGIKGPLRPAPKAVAPPPPAVDNPATPPATTSPALPPPSSTNERKP